MVISLGNSYSEDQSMYTFLENLYQGGKQSSQIASHKTELRRDENFVHQKLLCTSNLKIDYFNIKNSVRNN